MATGFKMTQIQSSMNSIAGNTIHTLSAGEKSNQPVLLLHGKAFQAQTWKDLRTLKILAENNCFGLALDLPGWGKSPKASFSAQKIISGLLNKYELEIPIIIGPSMGGKIAIEYSLENPHETGGLVLIGAVGVQENRSRLQELPERTLIIWGENDHISDPTNGDFLHKKIKGSQHVIIPNTKHACYIEDPEIFHQQLIAFVNNKRYINE